jgi:hypothetical protein
VGLGKQLEELCVVVFTVQIHLVKENTGQLKHLLLKESESVLV